MKQLTDEQVREAVTLLSEANTAKWVAKELGIPMRDLLAMAERYGYPDLDRLARSADVLNRASKVAERRAARQAKPVEGAKPTHTATRRVTVETTMPPPESTPLPREIPPPVSAEEPSMQVTEPEPSQITDEQPLVPAGEWLTPKPAQQNPPQEFSVKNKITVTVDGVARDYDSWHQEDFLIDTDPKTGWLTVKTPVKHTILARWDSVDVECVGEMG